ncbi:MAG: ABC transporter permease, partial [Bacteroidota bacterium]
MLFANLRHTLRHLQRQPIYTAINVLGLALGLACVLLILLYVADERSFDTMHTNADRIYRVEQILNQENGHWASTPWPVADFLEERVPAIEAITQVQHEAEPLMSSVGSDIQFYEDHVLSVAPNFFDLFDFDVVEGSVERLAEPNTALLSRSAAARYFPDERALGQTLVRHEKWSADATTYEIVGLIDDMPRNVHFRGDILLSIATNQPKEEQKWYNAAFTYVLLRDGAGPEVITDQQETLNAFMDGNYAPRGMTLSVIPLTRIHLHSEATNDIAPQGDIRYIYLFSAIALLILLIACINYTNLATARAAQRAKEVGVRKSVGAARRQLIGQFLGESVLMALAAVVLAMGIVQLVLPAFNVLMERSLTLPLAHPVLWLGVLTTGTIVGVLAGAYPAFVLSLFRPATVLKGDVRMRSLPALRKSLIVFQFAVSVVLIVCTLVIQDQLHFVQHGRLGFDQDQVAVVHTRAALPAASAESFQQALAQHPSVMTVARASGIPSEPTAINFFGADEIEAYDGDFMVFQSIRTSPELREALQLEMAEGRFFDAGRPADLADGIVINETALQRIGWADPIGRTIQSRNGTLTVIGVVRDFHMEDMRTDIEPLLMQAGAEARRFYTVRFDAADVPGMLAHLE